MPQAARIMLDETRGDNTVVRVGGDEFVLIFKGMVDCDKPGRKAGWAILPPVPWSGLSGAQQTSSKPIEYQGLPGQWNLVQNLRNMLLHLRQFGNHREDVTSECRMCKTLWNIIGHMPTRTSEERQAECRIPCTARSLGDGRCLFYKSCFYGSERDLLTQNRGEFRGNARRVRAAARPVRCDHKDCRLGGPPLIRQGVAQ